MSVVVPGRVRQRAMSGGGAGQRWLDDLPEVVEATVARWDLELGDVYDGGTAAYVVAATDASGRAVVLKVAMPLDVDEIAAFEHSVIVHRLAEGRGCAELVAVDESARILLLERLGPNLDDLAMSVPQAIETIADTLHAFWRPVPRNCGLRTGAEKAAWLASYITATWESLGRPCEQAVVDRALGYCGARADAFDGSDAVLVHGDAHGWNTVVAGDGYKFVDPEGLVSERAHDLSVPMREYNEPLLAGDTATLVRERAEFLAERCDVDAEAVWEWGFVERVSTGLANLREFDRGGSHEFLEVARRCL